MLRHRSSLERYFTPKASAICFPSVKGGFCSPSVLIYRKVRDRARAPATKKRPTGVDRFLFYGGASKGCFRTHFLAAIHAVEASFDLRSPMFWGSAVFITAINECAEVILLQIRAIRQRTEKHLSAALVVYPRISQVFRKFTSNLRVNLFLLSEACLRVFKDSSKQ